MKIFISSTYTDLRQHRRVLIDSLLALDSAFEILAMEYFGDDPSSSIKLSRSKVKDADIYLGVFGWRYGTVDRATKMSVTEIEYRTALASRLPSYNYLLSEEHAVVPAAVETGSRAHKILKLRAEIQERHVVQFFTTPEDLGRRATIDVARYLRVPGQRQPKFQATPTEPVDERINPAHPYVFCHLAARSAVEGRYDIKIFIDVVDNNEKRYRAAFAAIDRVVYQLHPSFDLPVAAMQNWRQGFMIRPNVYGEFWARATIYFKQPRRAPIVLDRYINVPHPNVDAEL